MLMSYRILFAYSKKSRHLFFRQYEEHQEEPGLRDGAAFWAKLLSSPRSKQVGSLPRCFWPPAVTDSLGHPVDQEVFDMSCDFTILGKKLELLQNYGLKHHPRKLRDMWYDRRNRQQWVTFWVANIYGGIAILLTLAQVIQGSFK
jgi:hypothetical protein